jgi:uncharacterized membrane protein
MPDTTEESPAPERGSENERWVPGLSPGRIEALCDGVFAIAMTILVLELTVPHFAGNVPNLTDAVGEASHAEEVTSFMEMAGEFYIYALAFLTLGIYWVLHHYMFHFIKRSNGVLVWMNVLFLVFASLVPFSSAVLRENTSLVPGEVAVSNAPYTFFAVTTMMSILILLGMWIYATGGHRLVDPGIDPRVVSALKRSIVIGVGTMFIGVVLSFYVPIASMLGFGAMAFMIGITMHARHGVVS